MSELKILIDLAEKLGPVAAIFLIAAFAYYRDATKPIVKTTPKQTGFDDSQKLYLKENVVEPILSKIESK